MIRVDGDRVVVSGEMTLPGATELLAEGSAVLVNADALFDLAEVTDVDSSAISVIFGWLRAARLQGKAVRVVHPPKELLSLAEVYGVAELLPLT